RPAFRAAFFDRSRGAVSADIFIPIPAVRPPSRTREPPNKEADQTADKQPAPSDLSDDDGLEGRGPLSPRCLSRRTLLTLLQSGKLTVGVGIVARLFLLVSALLARGHLGSIPM